MTLRPCPASQTRDATKEICPPDMAHPRFYSAHWPEPLTASGAAQACPTCLPSPANQLTGHGDMLPDRPIERAVHFVPVPSQLGGSNQERPAFQVPQARGWDMKLSRSHMAHSRFYPAHWPEPLTAPGAAQACPTCLPSPANQQTSQGDSRPDRPIERAVRFAPVPSQLGDFTEGQPAVFPFRIPATNALIGGRRAGSQGFRPLTPLPSTPAPNQRNSANPLGFARPFVPSSPSPKPRLRAQRIGGLTSFDLSPGALGNEFRDSLKDLARQAGLPNFAVVFPVPDDRRDSDFRTKSPVGKNSVFPSGAPGVRRPTKRLAAAHPFSSQNPNT